MNDSDRNNPKPLPDDFGMTLPNYRPPKQKPQPDNFDLTTPNLRSPNQQNKPSQPPALPPDDFGMTIPSIQRQPRQPSPPNDFDLTAPNIRPNTPPEPDFGLTMPGGNYSSSAGSREPDFGATMPYISLPQSQRDEIRQETQPPVVPVQTKSEEKRRGIPIWAWLVSGGLAFVAILAIGLLAVYFLFWRDTGFTLVVKGAPAGSTIFVDGTRRGVTSGDGSTKIFGLKADDKRSIKVTKEGFTEFNDTVIGEDGKEKEIIAQMRETKTAVAPPVANDCEGEDLRVCEAERAAMDALDKLVPPFTADELARALNLHIINFESNSADVPPARKRFLEKAAVKFGQVPKTSVFEIGGHTDNVGAAASNLNLSLDRAKAVRGLLVNFGVSPGMITSKGYGSAKPKTENTTENGRFQNRRIEYTVTAR